MRPRWSLALAVLASAAACAVVARAQEVPALAALLFVALVPWLLAQGRVRRLAGAVLLAWLFTVAFTAAVFQWFGAAIGAYVEVGEVAGVAVLLLAAPLFQPQIIMAAVVRHLVGCAHGPLLRAVAASCAWVATEAWWPKLLGDSLGHGLYPLPWLRQGASLGGVALLTLSVLLVNEAVAHAVLQWRARMAPARPGQPQPAPQPALAWPLGLALGLPLMLAVYGLTAGGAPQPSSPGVSAAQTLRLGLVQSNIVHYERLRRERGTGAVVREVLDTHYAMSYDAVERRGAQAVLWSETVYPTTFLRPKSEAGAELDQEILGIVKAAGVPFVFGTYDRDDAGEYNAAAFVTPQTGLLGFYRKTRPFPFTEAVPAWLDGPLLRRWLPWTGNWRAGDGARVFPLRLKDGREVPVLPLICLDDVDTRLGLDGARLGAQAILTMSNDAWFTDYPLGARLHLVVAAFRSIETGLPQFRVTSNGYSAIIDAAGNVQAQSRMGERTLVIGDGVVREPPRTPLVVLGDWVGRVASAFLLVLGLMALGRLLSRQQAGAAALTAGSGVTAEPPPVVWPARVALLSPRVRWLAATLRLLARGAMLAAALALALGLPWLPSHPMTQLRLFAALVLAPELASWLLLRAFAAEASLRAGSLWFSRGKQLLELPLHTLSAVRAWRWPWPRPGADLLTQPGASGPYALVDADAQAWSLALAAAGARAPLQSSALTTSMQRARELGRGSWASHPVVRYALYPLLLALMAYTVHQHIAFGSSFGEVQAFGMAAYAKGLALWWAAWAMGMAIWAAVLDAVLGAATLLCVRFAPGQALVLRRPFTWMAWVLYYLAPPLWLWWRTL